MNGPQVRDELRRRLDIAEADFEAALDAAAAREQREDRRRRRTHVGLMVMIAINVIGALVWIAANIMRIKGGCE